MIVPGRLTLGLAALLAILLLGAVVDPVIGIVALIADVVLLVAFLLQGQSLRKLPVDVVRGTWPRAQVGEPQSFGYQITNRSRRVVFVYIRQNWPATVASELNEVEVAVQPGEIVKVALSATASARGAIAVEPAEIDLRFKADLAHVRRLSDGGTIEVFPSLRGMSEYEALRRHHASSLAGLHRQRMLGAGREFDQLREYVPDDDFRDINWKATARRNHPITNKYQAERSQEILLCIDCGRMMGDPVGASTALDHAIDGCIMLAHVANRQGDRVGLALFNDVVQRFIKPAAGMPAVHRIIEELVHAKTEGVFPSYGALMTAVRTHQNRRSLIFLFTDLNDPQLAANLVEVLPMASRRHVLVVISLRDPMVDRVASGAAEDTRGVYKVLAARQLASERAARARELQRIGATVLEADAGSLTVDLLNTYLTIKSRQL